MTPYLLILYLVTGANFAHPEELSKAACESWRETIKIAIEQGATVVDGNDVPIVRAECRPADEVKS